MTKRIQLEKRFTSAFVSENELKAILPEALAAQKKLAEGTGDGADFIGWRTLPEDYDREEFTRIKAAAEKIRKNSDVLIVIGIGGSYLGARAAIEFLRSQRHNELNDGSPAVYFSGCNISGTDLCELLEICRDKDVSLNVISKSGTTTEPAISFRILRDMIIRKYGAEKAKDHIFVTTDKCRGTLKKFADEEGYETFVVPDNVGGRYSVLTAVGLLPIAAAGIDIDELMTGAHEAMTEYNGNTDMLTNDACLYASLRNIFYRSGKTNEILVGYESYQTMFNEWWKQLYGESEGKDNKGIFPASVVFSTDLHSMGQYIQQGIRNLFETVCHVLVPSVDISVPHDDANVDGLNYLDGVSMNEINNNAINATLLAHVDGGVPNIVLNIEGRTERSLGWMIYFFEYACAISGYMLGVNPFNQPGVEEYKKNMFALLGKPGYEEKTAEIKARLK